MKKIRLYKNPNRVEKPTITQYVPEYVNQGIEPTEFVPTKVPLNHRGLKPTGPTESRRGSHPHQESKLAPYATSESAHNPIPNVGNNTDKSWVSVDGDDFDNIIVDESNKALLDPNESFIDNNEDDEANYANIPKTLKMAPVPQSYEDDESDSSESQELSLSNLLEEEYALIINDEIICSGESEYVQEQVKKLLFGEHDLNKAYEISQEDLVVIKRIKINVGVFLG